jgi:hypothetical protein
MDIIQLSLSSATIAKVLVDLLRQTTKVPSWTYPLLALVFGIISSLLLVASNDVVLTTQTVSQGIIAGIMAAGSAVGITELQKRAL